MNETQLRLRLPLIVILVAMAALPLIAYDHPLTTSAIHDAYFLGTGPKGTDADFYAGYFQILDMPHKRERTSQTIIETPYFQVAKHARETPNYTAQDAVKEFASKPLSFRAYLDVYFDAPVSGDPKPVVVKLRQRGKEIAPSSTDRWPLSRFRDENTGDVSVGERVWLTYDADKFQQSDITFSIDAPDGEHAEATFELAKLR